MDNTIAAMKKEVLVEIVKMVQKQRMTGNKGSWKEFLNFYDKRFGDSLSDPGRRTVDVLLAFLQTFTTEEDYKFFAKVMQCYSNREVVGQLKIKADNESSEHRLVRLTLGHPRYPKDYSFPSHEEEWMVTKPQKNSKSEKLAKMIAVDCEMVLCEDGREAIVRVCVVDRNLKVKLDEVVKPNAVVADYRTEITGITAKDLDNITCSLVDIQKSMKKLLRNGTILVGHGLNNDLQALKIDHARVIDTSFIFKYPENFIQRRPSLNYLCKSVLGYDVRKAGAPHNCLDDARAAMELVLAKIEQGYDHDLPLVHESGPETETAKLLLHRIPDTVPIEVLHEIIPGCCQIEKKQVKKGPGGGKYSAFAIFKNLEDAHEAFENILGNHEKDSFGRPQKLVSFNHGMGETANLYIRKMKHDYPASEVPSKRSSQQNEAASESKRLKRDQNIEEPIDVEAGQHLCEGHVNEIERLKRLVSERDDEISMLNKIIASLARKQGL